MEHGATRNFQAEKLLEEEEKRVQKEREDEELNNPMKVSRAPCVHVCVCLCTCGGAGGISVSSRFRPPGGAVGWGEWSADLSDVPQDPCLLVTCPAWSRDCVYRRISLLCSGWIGL